MKLGGAVLLLLGCLSAGASTIVHNLRERDQAEDDTAAIALIAGTSNEERELLYVHETPPDDCPGTVDLPDSSKPRGVSYFRAQLEAMTIPPPGTNQNKVGVILGEQDCTVGGRRSRFLRTLGKSKTAAAAAAAAKKKAEDAMKKAEKMFPPLPPEALLEFEYSHMVDIVYEAAAAPNGCWSGGIEIWRPSGDCLGDVCTYCKGLSHFSFQWKKEGSNSLTTTQCFVSGTASLERATASDIGSFFYLVDTNEDGVLDLDEFKQFWQDVQLKNTSLSTEKLNEWFSKVDSFLDDENDAISEAEFGAALAEEDYLVVDGKYLVITKDNAAAIEMFYLCQGSSAPQCYGY